MKDIAARTGLGIATISKYLNGGHVLEKNQIAIENAVKELDFQVNGIARCLKTRKSKTIGVVIPQLNNLFMTSIVTRIEEILRANGYAVIVCDSGKSTEQESDIIQFLVNKMVDGIILMTAASDTAGLDIVRNRHIPLVLIDRRIDSMKDYADMVLIDNYDASYSAIRFLTDHGHREIGLLVGNMDVSTANERCAAYVKAAEDAGINVDRSKIRYTDFSMQDAYRQTIDLLDKHREITAIFATNFEMTLGALLALNDQGISIPKQISLIGFDNASLAKAMNPKLTIVSQPFDQIGEKAAEMMLKRLDGVKKDFKPETVILKADIVQGASVEQV